MARLKKYAPQMVRFVVFANGALFLNRGYTLWSDNITNRFTMLEPVYNPEVWQECSGDDSHKCWSLLVPFYAMLWMGLGTIALLAAFTFGNYETACVALILATEHLAQAYFRLFVAPQEDYVPGKAQADSTSQGALGVVTLIMSIILFRVKKDKFKRR